MTPSAPRVDQLMGYDRLIIGQLIRVLHAPVHRHKHIVALLLRLLYLLHQMGGVIGAEDAGRAVLHVPGNLRNDPGGCQKSEALPILLKADQPAGVLVAAARAGVTRCPRSPAS